MRHDEVLEQVQPGEQLLVACRGPEQAAEGWAVVALGRCVAQEPHCLVPELLTAGAAEVALEAWCPDPAHRERSNCLIALCPGLVRYASEMRGAQVKRILRPGSGVSRRALLGLRPANGDAERLLAAMTCLAERQGPAKPPPGTVVLHATADCTACGACVGACPNDALALVGEEILTLTHDRTVCDGVGACVRICPERALSAVDSIDSPETTELITVTAMVCDRCTLPTAWDRSGLCRQCRGTVSNPFQVRLPPGFTRSR